MLFSKEPKQIFGDLLFDLLVLVSFTKFLLESKFITPPHYSFVLIAFVVAFLLGITHRFGSVSTVLRVGIVIASLILFFVSLTEINQVFYTSLIVGSVIVYSLALIMRKTLYIIIALTVIIAMVIMLMRM